MKLKDFLLMLPLAGALGLTSCIRDEAASVECDITGLDSAWIASLPQGFLSQYKIEQTPPARVTFVAKDIDYSKPLILAPHFRVSRGATLYHFTDSVKILPDGTTGLDGSTKGFDFRYPQEFRVQSEDGAFAKPYTVVFTELPPFTACDFEHIGWDNNNRNYQTLLQTGADGTIYEEFWDSGNAGFKLTGMGKTPEDYPTSFPAEVESGNRVTCLKTCDTSNFGMMTRPRMPIAAGNLFIGTFNVSSAMTAPRKATKFGRQIVNSEPVALAGRYKYTAGETMVDQNKNALPEMHDTADIYAVVYEVDDPANFVPLNGDDVLTSERIVLMARIDNPGEPKEWTQFREPFRPMNGKTFSTERMRNRGYAMAIVMTSSRQGAYFIGAIGSTLYVDDLRVEWKDD